MPASAARRSETVKVPESGADAGAGASVTVMSGATSATWLSRTSPHSSGRRAVVRVNASTLPSAVPGMLNDAPSTPILGAGNQSSSR